MFGISRRALLAWLNLSLTIEGTIVSSIPLTSILFAVVALKCGQKKVVCG